MITLIFHNFVTFAQSFTVAVFLCNFQFLRQFSYFMSVTAAAVRCYKSAALLGKQDWIVEPSVTHVVLNTGLPPRVSYFQHLFNKLQQLNLGYSDTWCEFLVTRSNSFFKLSSSSRTASWSFQSRRCFNFVRSSEFRQRFSLGSKKGYS